MIKGKGKGFSISAAICGVGVLLVWAFFLIRDRITEDRAIDRFLHATTSEERAAAAGLLGDLGSFRAIPSLIDSQRKKSRGIMSPLGKDILGGATAEEESLRRIIERRGASAAPVLARLLLVPDSEVREEAARWLAEIGPEAQAAIPALEAAFSRSPSVAAAGEALAEIGYPGDRILPGLIPFLDDFETESTAVRAILALGNQAETAIPALVGKLRAKDNAIQRKIAPLLAGRDARTVVLLCWMLLDDREANQRANLQAILQLDASVTVPILVGLLDELEYPDAWEFDEVFSALAKIGPRAKGAAPALLRRSALMEQSKEDANLRDLPGPLILTLGCIGADSPEVLALLQKNLSDTADEDAGEEDAAGNDSRAAAAKALAFLGPPAAIASRRLEEVAEKDGDLRARTWAACALAMIDRTRMPRLVSELIRMLKEERRREEGELHFPHSDPFFGELGPPGLAADVLCHLGPTAKAAMPHLLEQLVAVLEKGDGDPEVVELMIEALIRIGVEDTTVEPFIRDLQRGEHGRRVRAIRVLHRFGKAAMPAMAALRGALRDPSPDIRFPAAMVLLDLDSGAADAIRVLEQALSDRRRRIRNAARYHLLMRGQCFAR